ncbi:3'(2'),5'-bisphosphate nucleotidase CysQ [Euryhalocaulis caribicus]|uniref:3'(2'),5'-bisphosphate nucleotidase CysQ n=1 Tax=Euryhalocaulis caribicus TaxID=1161401 RepID=UPI00039C5B8A|nr:3'(2'),5'-bisphosphate nucleotidase CysQ [Euryhalocaulis caribicus]
MSAGEDLALLKQAALAAGAAAMPWFEGDKDMKVRQKGDEGPVTAADLAVNDLLKERLLGARPDYAWLSEESAEDPARHSARRVFIIDPIDGTRAFINGKPHFTVCAAVVEDGRPIAGVVYNPAREQLYSAHLGGGAFLNDAPVRATQPASLDGIRMVCQPDFIASKKWPEPWPDMHVELCNSMAYRIALVASGAWDAALAPNPKSDWDIAAADILATEAGARMTGLDGAEFRYNQERTRHSGVICAAPEIHEKILQRVRAFPRR